MQAESKVAHGVVSSDTLAAHLQEIIVQYETYRTNCGRSDNREPVAIPVQVVELDDQLSPIAEPCHMVTRDVSVGGAGLFHSAPLQSEYVMLKFNSPITMENLTVIARVEHCTRIGVYYLIGCRFLAK